MTTIRPEQPGDVAAVRTMYKQAFSQPLEADLVDSLRTACAEAVSLVAVLDGLIVGHILFTPVTIQTQTGDIRGMGLGPMAVVPEHQRQRIGSRLVKAGLELLRRRCPFVVVLGHAEYYPRFGFAPASQHGIHCQWDGVPDNVFMAVVFDRETMAGVSGVARYRNEFEEAVGAQ
jgi:putative acetyltransferase